MELGKYSFGVGDRFGMQGRGLLRAFESAADKGVIITPVWNKSFREHKLTGTIPSEVRIEADEAVTGAGWKLPYFVDADHINEKNVGEFIGSSDFFTIDVAGFIGAEPDRLALESSLTLNSKYIGSLKMPGFTGQIRVTPEFLANTSKKFLAAAIQAGRIYKDIENRKGKGNFITEVSMDEVDSPQNPAELFFILGLLSQAGIPVNTIAPRFTGNFHKGVDYSGDIKSFETEFEQDLLILDYARSEFGLPDNLKLSIHSGSDKRSLYHVINRLIHKHNKGIHIKTAGTTWLEEFTGIILSGERGYDFAKSIYSQAVGRAEELIGPYAYVTKIDLSNLPGAEIIKTWPAEKFARTIIHDAADQYYNPDLRQFIHLSYKIAAENITEYRELIRGNSGFISGRVTDNIFSYHIKPLFLDRL